MSDEMVLVFPRSLLDEIGAFQGLRTDIDAYVPRILEARNTRYAPRSLAEEDPSLKQIIPYVLVRRGRTLLHYVRGKASGEKRLVAMGSIGIGGHINHRDEDLFGTGLDFYEDAVQRELHEELRIDAVLTTRIVALINDDSTPVGRVHFGVVHLCELGDEDVSRGEACITDLRFLTLPELLERRDRLESWSQFCLDFVADRRESLGLGASSATAGDGAVLETERLVLRRLGPDDAAFIRELVNEPAWLRFIGDKHVRTLDDARDYILKGPMASYARHGFGLLLVAPKEGGAPAGICGLLKRDTLDDVDIGFAFLERVWGRGYAYESAAGVMRHAWDTLGLRRVVAITTPDNERSIRVLAKVGMVFERTVRLGDAAEELSLFGAAPVKNPGARADT